MLRRFRLVFCVLAVWSSPAWADYAAGVRAWGRGDFAAAANQFLPAAQAGDAEAQFMVGRLYSLGDGVAEDFAQAWIWFDRAARQGHVEAALARDALQEILNPAQLAAVQGAAASQPTRPAQITLAVPPPDNRAVVLVPRQGVVIAPPASFFAPGPSEAGRLRQVQERLNLAGYDAGPVDGVLGPRTRDAIRAWQEDNDQTASGMVTAELLAGLSASQQAER